MKRSPMKRGGRIKPKKRTASEFRRIYGSRARVAFVKTLACANCQLLTRDHSGWIKVVNAHIETDGMGRKADYTKIIPLCETIYKTGCHDRQHKLGWACLEWLPTPESRQDAAKVTEMRWKRFLAGGSVGLPSTEHD